MTALEGSPIVSVIGEAKSLQFNGTGVGQTDAIRWTSANLGSDSCFEKFFLSNAYNVSASNVATITFENYYNGTMYLCYKFGDEPYAHFSQFNISLAKINGLNVLGNDILDTAVVGHTKQFELSAYGKSDNDRVKFVTSVVSKSSECGVDGLNSYSGYGNAEINLNSRGQFNVTFQLAMNNPDDRLGLCVKLGIEPYVFLSEYKFAVRTILGIDRTVVLSFTQHEFFLNGIGLQDLDYAGWTSDENCDQRSESDSIVSKQRATFNLKTTGKLTLCYKFAGQPFVLFPQLQVLLVEPFIRSAKYSSVVGQEISVIFYGTFGYTTKDSYWWVDGLASNCDSAVGELGSYIETRDIAVQANNILLKNGTASSNISVVIPGTINRTWKLCYKFGEYSDAALFENVVLLAAHVTLCTIVEQTLNNMGTNMTFSFSGTGLQENDIAKWVSDDILDDEGCLSAIAAGGSAAAIVNNNLQSTYNFKQNAGNLKLCYKFGDHPYKLYPNMKVIDASVSATDEEARPGRSASLRTEALISVRVLKNFNDIPKGSTAENTFKANFTTEIATALNIPTNRYDIVFPYSYVISIRIVIQDLLSGSIIVKFKILPATSMADPTAIQLSDLLKEKLTNASATIYEVFPIYILPRTIFMALLGICAIRR